MALDDRIVDVTDPAASGLNAAWALVRGSGNGAANSTNLANILTAAFTGSPATGLSLYFPVGDFYFATTVTFPNVNSFRVIGGGGMCKGLSQVQAHSGNCTYLIWEGGTTGPMFRMQNTDGDVWENLNFDGALGPDTNAGGAGSGLDVLIKHLRSGGGSGALYHHYKNCTFFRAQRLFWAAKDAEVPTGTAEFTFSKCLFNCGELTTTAWNAEAYYSDNLQSVNVVFDSNCEWNNCGYCVYLKDAGRCMMFGPTIAFCGTLLVRDGGSQNGAGDLIAYPHLDGGNASEGRKALYASVNASSTMGPVVLETPKYGSVAAVTDEFAEITSFSGTTLVLTNPIAARVGDRLMFVPKTNIDDPGDKLGTGKVETTIATRTDNDNYTTADSATSLGITDPADWYCANGEALVTCVSSDFVELRNAFLTAEHMWGGRLARLTHSNYSTGRSPKLVVSNAMAFWEVPFTKAGLQSLLTITGTAWWRFENADPINDAGGTPQSFGNFGLFGDPMTDIDFERVPIERTYMLYPTEDEGLVAEATKSFSLDSDPLIAVEFVHDLPVGGYINSVATPVIESGNPSGLTFLTGRDKSQVKLRVTTVQVGMYVLSVTVTYNDGSTATGKFNLEVVE